MAAKVSVADLLEARRLRRQAAEILDDCYSMARDLVRIGEATDWMDPSLQARELTIRRFEEIREGLLAKAREIESGQKGRAA